MYEEDMVYEEELYCGECHKSCNLLCDDDDLCCICVMTCYDESCAICQERLPREFWDC